MPFSPVDLRRSSIVAKACIPGLLCCRSFLSTLDHGSHTLGAQLVSCIGEMNHILRHIPLHVLGDGRMQIVDLYANFGEQLSALANCWKNQFGGDDAHVFYTVPGKSLASKVTKPTRIQGTHTPIEIGKWSEIHSVIEKVIQ